MGSYVGVEVGGLYETNNSGWLEVLSIKSAVSATVRFIETGYTSEVELGVIRTGQVKDWSESMAEKKGSIFPTLQCGDVEILQYIDAHNVEVRFLNTGNEASFPAGNIKRGKIMDWLAPLVYGVGCMGIGQYNSVENKKAYQNWAHMLERCHTYTDNFKNYFDKFVTEDWLNFQNFVPWAESQTGFDLRRWQLDKDILIPGNKEYRPEACCYVPGRINSLIIKSDVEGTTQDRFGNYYFRCRDENGKRVSKSVKDKEEGKEWYKKTKEDVVKKVADQYKNELDSRVYEALYSWQVN